MPDDDAVKQLEATIRSFLQPLQDVPFPVVVKAISGHEVIPFDAQQTEDQELLAWLFYAAELAGTRVREKGILRERANEAGNDLEDFVVAAAKEMGFKAGRPTTKSGRHQETGYPDLQIVDRHRRVTYLECKTYRREQLDSSLRAFYLSPGHDPKITADARHLIISYELTHETRGNQSVFVPVHWAVYDACHLKVDLKYEFNASNSDMYLPEALLSEGLIPALGDK